MRKDHQKYKKGKWNGAKREMEQRSAGGYGRPLPPKIHDFQTVQTRKKWFKCPLQKKYRQLKSGTTKIQTVQLSFLEQESVKRNGLAKTQTSNSISKWNME